MLSGTVLFFIQLITKRQRAKSCCWGGTEAKLSMSCGSVLSETQCTASVVSVVGPGSSALHHQATRASSSDHCLLPVMPWLTFILHKGKSNFIHLFLISGKIEAGRRKVGFSPFFFLFSPGHRARQRRGRCAWWVSWLSVLCTPS